MDTKYITYILAIAERKNMTKAAEDLYVSQSSLSQYLSKLEQELGTPLFYRTKGELVPTPAGELYIEACKKVMEIKNQLYQNISGLENRGHIGIGITSQFGLRMMTDIIPKYKKEYPDVQIEISEGSVPQVKKMILEENVDIGIMAGNTIIPFEGQTDILRNEEVFFAIPIDHPYRKKNPGRPISVEELVKEFKDDNFLMAKRGSSIRLIYDDLFADIPFEPTSMCETNSIPTVRSMIAAHNGVSFLAESCSRDRDKIAYYSLDPKAFRLNLLVHRKNWVMNDPEQAFCTMIKNYFILNTERPYLA